MPMIYRVSMVVSSCINFLTASFFPLTALASLITARTQSRKTTWLLCGWQLV